MENKNQVTMFNDSSAAAQSAALAQMNQQERNLAFLSELLATK